MKKLAKFIQKTKHGKKLAQIGEGENLDIAWHPKSHQFSYVVYEMGQHLSSKLKLMKKNLGLKLCTG